MARASAIIVKDRSVLLIHRIKKGEEYFVLPGGTWEEGESIEETAIRECLEETSLEVTLGRKVLELKNHSDGKVNHIFLVNDFTGVPELGGEERERNSEENAYELMWISLEELSNINLVPSEIKKVVTSILQNKLKRVHADKRVRVSKVLWEGDIQIEDVLLVKEASQRKINRDIEEQIPSVWKSLRESAAANGEQLHNGRVVCLNSIAEEEGKIILKIYIMEYRERISLKHILGFLELPDEYMSKGVASMVDIVTSDGFHILGIRPNGKKTLVGGVFEERHEKSAFKEHLLEEIEEEVGISRKCLGEIKVRQMTMSEHGGVGVLCRAFVELSAEEVLAKFPRRADLELSEIKLLPEDKFIAELEAMGGKWELVANRV